MGIIGSASLTGDAHARPARRPERDCGFAPAIACARAVIAANPKFTNARALLASALEETGDVSGAARPDRRWHGLVAKLPPLPLATRPRLKPEPAVSPRCGPAATTGKMAHRSEGTPVSITITDPALLAQLRQAADVVELKDPDGDVLGKFSAEGLGTLPPGVKSPFTPEQMDERRKQRSGRPLKDILRDLEARGQGA